MKARGKRAAKRARRPWSAMINDSQPWKGVIACIYFGLSGLDLGCSW